MGKYIALKTVRMSTLQLTGFLLIVGTAPALTCVAQDLPPRYVVTELEHPDGNGVKTLVPFDIDEAGRIAGFAFHGYGQKITRQPFLLENSKLQLVPVNWDFAEAHCLDQEGNAYGTDLATGSIIHATPTGVTAVASAPVNSYSTITHATSSGWVAGNHYDLGFLWHPDSGYIQLSDSDSGDPATFADINEAGIATGTINIASYTTARAFVWQDGAMIDLAPQLSGVTRATSIDTANRILLSHEENETISIRFAILDDDGSTLQTPVLTVVNAVNLDALAGETNVIAITWYVDNDPNLAMVPPSGNKAVDIQLPPYTLGVEVFGITDAGVAYGRVMDTNYEMQGFVSTIDGGLSILNHRLIGEPPLQFYGIPRDSNASGALIIRYAHNYNYSHWALIEPARPGDADGDGNVNIIDILSIVGAWGIRMPDAICGPDLDMNGVVDITDLLEALAHFDN